MNILQIVPELRSGGVERGTVDFAKYLVAQEHHSVVVSAGGSLVQSMVEADVTHYTLPVHKKSFFSILAQATNLPSASSIRPIGERSTSLRFAT